MNPAVLIVVSFAGQAVAAFLLGTAHEQGAFSTAIMIYFITRYYTVPLKIMAMKRAPASEQGAVSGTILFGQDLFSIVATTLCGAMIDNIGYSSTFYFLAALGAALLVIFIIYAVRDNARTKRERLS